MKKRFSKIASFLLALLVLFSTFSFTVEKHFCGEFLMDVSFIGHADDCGMDMEKVSAKKKNCCKDEVHHIEGQDELQQASIDEFNFPKQQFLVSFYISYNDLFIENESKKIAYKDASPPDIPLDYQVIYQSFLI
jgi:hypothetical protein